MDVAVLGTGGSLWLEAWDGQSWSTGYLGGVGTSAPAVVSWGPGRLDVFVRGTTGSLYHKWFAGGSWHGWEDLGGRLVGSPTVASWGPGRLDIFARAANNQLEHLWYDSNGWHGWELLGGTLTTDPGATSWGPGRIDVFAGGLGGVVYQRSYQGSWRPWTSLGGVTTSGVAATSRAPGQLDVAVRGTNNEAYQKFWSGSAWTAWVPVGGTLTSSPGLATWGPGQLVVFGRGTNNGLWYRPYGSGGWKGWYSAGGTLTAAPSATAWTAAQTNTIAGIAYQHQVYELSCEEASFQMSLEHQNIGVTQAQELASEGVDGRAGSVSNGVLRWGDPYADFVGNPNGSEIALTGYGTYDSTIARIAGDYHANVITWGAGISPARVYSAVLTNHPVVAWVTFDWLHHAGSATWDAFDGRRLEWYGPAEHTVTVVGVNASSVYVYNPWFGPQWVSKATFEASYSTYGDMAVISQ